MEPINGDMSTTWFIDDLEIKSNKNHNSYIFNSNNKNICCHTVQVNVKDNSP